MTSMVAFTDGTGRSRFFRRLRPDPAPEPPPPGPTLPMGRRIELPGRGTTFVREVEGPPGAATILLLHGWIASGGLNWFTAFEPLGEHFRVLAIDHRGHGRGLRSWRRFTLTDCADDAAALLHELETGPVIAAGYSMGGPIAQLLWKRHPELVDGLVLAATGWSFVPVEREKYIFTTGMAALAGTTLAGELVGHLPAELIRRMAPPEVQRVRPNSLSRWAAAEMRRHSYRAVAQAGVAVGNYDASHWLDQIDVPTSVIVTTKDRGIPAESQLKMARAIKGASVFPFDDGHLACARQQFGDVLVQASRDVVERMPTRRGLFRR